MLLGGYPKRSTNGKTISNARRNGNRRNKSGHVEEGKKCTFRLIIYLGCLCHHQCLALHKYSPQHLYLVHSRPRFKSTLQNRPGSEKRTVSGGTDQPSNGTSRCTRLVPRRERNKPITRIVPNDHCMHLYRGNLLNLKPKCNQGDDRKLYVPANRYQCTGYQVYLLKECLKGCFKGCLKA